MLYTNQCFLVEVATSTSCSMHTQVVNFHIVMEIWLGQSLHIHISTDGHWMIMMIAHWWFKLIKSCALWFMVDLWPMYSSLCQHKPKLISSMQQQLSDKVKEVKNTWILVGASRSGHSISSSSCSYWLCRLTCRMLQFLLFLLDWTQISFFRNASNST